MKFKNDIEVQAGIKDSSGSDGTLGQVLSSTVSGVSWITPSTGITGSGTINFVPKWSSPTGLSNSRIIDNGFGIYIGYTSPASIGSATYALDIITNGTGQSGIKIINSPGNNFQLFRLENLGTGDYIQARSGITGSDVFSVNYLGDTTANSFIKTGGTSSQYLMADGSVSTGPSVSGYVPYTGATGNVDLGTHTLSSKNLVVNHASGSGVAAQITKGGNGEALTVVKSSGSGNAASITGGVTLLSELHLNTDLADAYIASAAIWNAKQNALNGTGFVKVVGTTVSYDNSTYVPTSRTITINGTTQNLSNDISFTVAGGVTSVFGRTGVVVAVSGDYNTSQVTENTNLYFTNARSRSAISLTTTGSSGPATYNSTTGVLNIPQYTEQFVGTVTSVGLTSSTSGVTIGSSPITTSGNITLSISTASGSQQGLLSSTDWTTFNNKQNALTNPITGTGTTNYLPKFTGASSLGNSLIFDNGTNVGIGTTSPSAKLSLYDTSDVYLNISRGSSFVNLGVDATGTFYNTSSIHRFLTASGSTEAMRITSSGNVGIGTTSPSERLDVIGNIKIGAGNRLMFSSTAYITPENNVSGAEIATGGILTIKTGGTTERVRVDGSGNVGIGTTSPIGKFDVRGNIFIANTDLSIGSAGSFLQIDQLASSGNTASQIRAFSNGGNATNNLLLQTGGGNVGIGTTSPGANLEVAVPNSLGSFSRFRLNSPYYNYWDLLNDSNLSFIRGTTEYMRITSNGDVCVGTTSANSRFNVTSPFGNTVTFNNTSGSGSASFLVLQASGNAIGSITRNGLANSVLYNTTSDYRLKEDFKNFKGLDLINNINVYNFKWKGVNQREYGVIAHELKEVIPNLVTGEKDAESMQQVDYSKLVPILVQAIQELKQEIEILKNK
jgi:hypothetical protein